MVTMQLINGELEAVVPEGVEFFWATLHENLVVFRNGEVLSVVGLIPNNLAEATRKANELLSTLRLSGN